MESYEAFQFSPRNNEDLNLEPTGVNYAMMWGFQFSPRNNEDLNGNERTNPRRTGTNQSFNSVLEIMRI